MKLYRILILTLCAYALISCGGAEERKAVYMEKAKSSIESGDLEKARIELKNVLQIDPKDAEGYYQLGKVYEHQKEYRKAYGNYLKAEELDPELLENQAALGRFYLVLTNEPDKTQEKIDLILSKEPANSDGLLLKAAVMLREKNIQEAINIAKSVIIKDPSHVEAVTFLASLYVKDNNLTDAINVLDNALKVKQDNEQLNKLLALVLVRNKDNERAEIIYKKFLERNPDSSSSYNNLANFYNQTGDKAKAEKTLRASIDNDLDNEDRILVLIKYIRETKGNDEAIKELKSFIATNNKLGKLRTTLAELYLLNGDKQSAIKVYENTINDFSEEATGVEARGFLAFLYMIDKDYIQASEVLEEAIEISPNDSKINHLRARLALHNNDIEKAIISLRIVTKETPENIEAFILLANTYQLENNKEQVRSTLNRAYDNNKMNPGALLKLAQYHLSFDINQAEKIIDDYNSIKESDYDGLSIKAAILNQNKAQHEAFKIAEVLMEKFPDRPKGYLQAIPYYSQQKDKITAVSILEKGYLSVKDNRKILILLTSLQVSNKQYDIVEKRLKAELAASPDDELKIVLAKVYIYDNQMDSAELLLNEVVESSPAIEESYLLLSRLYQGKNDLNAFKSILEKGNSSVVSSIKIALKLAAIYEHDKDYQKSINVYREANKSNPDNIVIINNLASMLADYGNEKEDLDKSKELIEKLKGREEPVFLDTIGWVYYKLGNSDKAIQYLTQVVEKMPDVNVFNYHLGMVYKMSGDKAQARVYLEKSLLDSKQFKQKGLAEVALKGL